MDYLGPNKITRVFESGKRGLTRRSEGLSGEELGPLCLALQMERVPDRDCRRLPEAGKDKEAESPQEPPAGTLILAQ